MRDLYKFIKIGGKEIEFILLLILRSPFDAIHTIILANFLRYSFEAIDHKNIQNLLIICFIFCIGNCLLFLYNGTIWIKFSSYVTRFVSIVRKKLFKHISILTLKTIDEKSSGEWFTRLNSDVVQGLVIINQPLNLPHAVCAIVNFSISFILLFLINRGILILVILFLILHLTFSQQFVLKPITELSKKSKEATIKNTTDLNALITCADTAMVYDAQFFLLEYFEKSSIKLRNANMKIIIRNAISNSILPFLGLGGYLLILVISSHWIVTDSMTFGELTAAFQYRGSVIASAIMFTNCLVSIRTAMVGVRRILETFNTKREE